MRYRRALPRLPFELPTEGFLFARNGQRWTEQLLLRRTQKACADAAVTRINVHTLHHAFCTYHLAAGESQGVVAALGGWRSLSMLDRYRDMSEDYVSLLDEEKQDGYLPQWPDGNQPNAQE